VVPFHRIDVGHGEAHDARVRVVWWARVAVAGAVGAFGCGGDDRESDSSAAATRGDLNSSTMPASSPSSVAKTADVSSTSRPYIATSSPTLDWTPPALSVESQSGRFEVGASSYSTSTMVADGTMPASGWPVAEGAAVQLVYPTPGWTFKAFAQREDGGRRMRLRITSIDEHRFDVAAPPPGSYEIRVLGKSSKAEQRGAGYVFRWVVLPG
jgi:hypothetical protein